MKNKKTIVILITSILIILVGIYFAFKISEKTAKKNNIETFEKNNVNTNINKQDNENNILLYNGFKFDNDYYQDLEMNIPYTEENKNKYEIKYYNYEDGKYLGESEGKLEETYEGVACVQNVKKLATSKKYNPIPRKYNKIEEIPIQMVEFEDYDKIEIQEIDLDGDGTLEKIVCASYEKEAQDTENGKYTNYSQIVLFDCNYNKIAKLVYTEDQYWEHENVVTDKFLFSTDDIEYFDIDEDGIMEIIIDLNVYEGIGIGLYKYDNGNIKGEINKQVYVLP